MEQGVGVKCVRVCVYVCFCACVHSGPLNNAGVKGVKPSALENLYISFDSPKI